MGKKVGALACWKSKTSEIQTILNRAISHLAILKRRRLAISKIARLDVMQLLRLNDHQQALSRVEKVIEHQNMLDVYDMIYAHCHFLIERIDIIEQSNDCPGDMKKVVSDILYAAPRCGQFPELQEIQRILTSRFGKDFANDAIELTRNHGVSQKMIQKLSPEKSSFEDKMNMLTGIVKENG
ncbi:hypothetical protein L1887_15764 [Cichorium endivia]|nr:hypothetical protein L1887_15764 [Cichorium endivia]